MTKETKSLRTPVCLQSEKVRDLAHLCVPLIQNMKGLQCLFLNEYMEEWINDNWSALTYKFQYYLTLIICDFSQLNSSHINYLSIPWICQVPSHLSYVQFSLPRYYEHGWFSSLILSYLERHPKFNNHLKCAWIIYWLYIVYL